MNKYQEALNNIKTAPSFMGGNVRYTTALESSIPFLEDIAILQELVDKETPMTPPLKWEYAKPQTRCKCSAGVEKYHNYCWNCGQKLDWSGDDE